MISFPPRGSRVRFRGTYQKPPTRYGRTAYRCQAIEARLTDKSSAEKAPDLDMGGMLALLKRHPLATFFVLAYALSWWAWILYAFGLSPNPLASFGPFLAAIVVLALTEGKAGVSGLFRRMIRWRVPPGWYAVALFLPAVLATTATVLNVLLGAEAPSTAELNGWTELFAIFAIVLLVPGLGGAWEEPGWRGYAFPRLQSRRSALVASLILGALIAAWHLRLMVAGQVAYSDIVLIFAGTIVYNWVFNNARGSVLIIMVMHAANNTVSGSFFSPMFSGGDSIRSRGYWPWSGLSWRSW
jgi:membrane protease YdiL (CAAX protease family)